MYNVLLYLHVPCKDLIYRKRFQKFKLRTNRKNSKILKRSFKRRKWIFVLFVFWLQTYKKGRSQFLLIHCKLFEAVGGGVLCPTPPPPTLSVPIRAAHAAYYPTCQHHCVMFLIFLRNALCIVQQHKNNMNIRSDALLYSLISLSPPPEYSAEYY